MHTPNAQLTSFELFTVFAHQLGASKEQESVAAMSDDGQRVEFFVTHKDFPSARCGYRANAPGHDDHAKLWLAEELATGALHRIMRKAPPTADATAITGLFGRWQGQGSSRRTFRRGGHLDVPGRAGFLLGGWPAE